MRLLKIALLIAVMLVCAAPSQAQILFSRKPKVNPNQRVPELIVIVKTNADERKRASAAEELRDYDVAVFSEIVPVLVDVLQHDKKHSVRLEALSSLAKIRPVTAAAGHALEKAAAEDDSVRVRLQARAVLPKYHLAGYLSKSSSPTPTEKKTTVASPPAPLRKQTQEPPLAEPGPITVPTPPPATSPRPITVPTPPPATAPRVETPTDRPVPRPFPPVAVPAPQTPPPAQGPSLFP